jgi:hypothetical protein
VCYLETPLARRANHFALSEVDPAYVKACREKYSSSVFRKFMISSTHPVSTRGAYRDRHGRGRRGAVDAAGVQRACAPTNASAAYGEIVRSRSPDAGIKLADDESAGDGGQTARRAEEITYKPSNHCAGNAGLSRLPCRCLRAQSAHFLCTQGPRVRPASGVPRALLMWRADDRCITRAFVPREWKGMSVARMSEAISGAGPAYRFAHAGYDDAV